MPPRPSCGRRRRLGRGRLNGACSRARPARNHNDDLRSAPATRMLARFSHPGQPPKNERPQLLRVGITPSTIMSPESAPCTEVSLGVRTRVQAWKPRRPNETLKISTVPATVSSSRRLRRPPGRSSSLRCGRSTSTPTSSRRVLAAKPDRSVDYHESHR